jgi:L-cysteine S-thiosulfotransferase
MNLSLFSRNILVGLMFPLCASLICIGCGPKSASGFRLPDGNQEHGQQAFIDLKCVSCHSVEGVNLKGNFIQGGLNVILGGETLMVRTYGELVTSIINPSHVISPKYKEQLKLEGKLSPMPEFNRSMTVEQMIDLVAFLQTHYRLPPPDVVIAH